MSTQPLNFLFIMPRLVQSVGDGYVFPLGIAYVSSSMKKAGFQVFTLNLNHRDGDVAEIIRNEIKTNTIHVIATGGLSPQYHLIKGVIEAAKKTDPNILTVVGGGIISADPDTAMEALEYADYGVIGEGELTMVDLARTLEGGGDVREVEGLIIRKATDFLRTNRRKDIVDIDAIPWPDYEGFDVDKYLDSQSAGFGGLNKKRMICMMASRSCPYNCTFCFHTNGRKYRQRSLDDFFAELDYLVSKFNIEYISMSDELFAPQADRARDFCARIKKYNIPWAADFRVDKVQSELLPVLKDAGLDVMFFGLESADNRILKSMKKGITVEQIESSLKAVYEAGIAVYGCFIFGDTEETVETSHTTLTWWRVHSQYHVHLTLVKPFPGSHIYEEACRRGIIKSRIQYLKDGCPQVNISRLSDTEFAEVVRLISEASSMLKPLKSVELLTFDPHMGRETVSGICSNCSHKNIWENIKLFAIDWIYCSQCGQKYDIPCPPQLRKNLDRNIVLLLRQYGKVAVWGMTLPIMDLFKQSSVLLGPSVYAIDIAVSKQAMDLHGQKIHDPTILDKEQIPVVIVAVPSHGGQITCQAKTEHHGVREIIDISWLVGENPVEPH